MVQAAARGLAKVVGIVVLAVVLVIVVLGVLFARGVLGLDDYVVRTVVGSFQHYIVPEIGFEEFSYDPPYTVMLTGVTFTATGGSGGEGEDGSGTGDAVEVVRASEAKLKLAKAPGYGDPIVIERISLVEPEVRLIREETAGGGMGFRGLVPFVKRDRVVEQEEQPPGKKLSELFELRKLELVDAGIVYDDGSGNPMVYRGIGLDMDITEEQGEDGGVLHRLAASFGDKPLLDVNVDGRLNLDELVVLVDSLTLSADLTSEAGISALPPQVQRLLGEREATGRLNLEASGEIKGREPLLSRLDALVTAEDVQAASGDLLIPVESMELPLEMSDGVARIPAMVIKMLEGEVRVTDTKAELTKEGMPTTVVWNVQELHLQELMPHTSGSGNNNGEAQNDPAGLHGLITTNGAVSLGLENPMETIDGFGTMMLREGQLVAIPVLTRLFRAMDLTGALRGEQAHDDTVDADFRLRPKGVVLDTLHISVPGAELKGARQGEGAIGVIGFDGSLEMSLRGGAVEAIPVIGQAVGSVTGRLARYDIGGTVSEPKVQIQAGRMVNRAIDEGADALQLNEEESGNDGGGEREGN